MVTFTYPRITARGSRTALYLAPSEVRAPARHVGSLRRRADLPSTPPGVGPCKAFPTSSELHQASPTSRTQAATAGRLEHLVNKMQTQRQAAVQSAA